MYVQVVYEPGQMSAIWPAANYMTRNEFMAGIRNSSSYYYTHNGSGANVGVMAMQLIIRQVNRTLFLLSYSIRPINYYSQVV
jgi:hypothetical protein